VAASSAIGWWGASTAIYGTQAVLATIRGFDLTMGWFATYVVLAWVGFLAYSISLGCAYTLQRSRVDRKSSDMQASWVFIAAGALMYVGGGLLPLSVPLVVWLLSRKDPLPAAA
jgi:hypothetical protein